MTKDEIINGLLDREAGYVNHRSDKGGPTNWGITPNTALAHGYSDIRSLTKEQARAITRLITGMGRDSIRLRNYHRKSQTSFAIPARIWARQSQVSFSSAGYRL